MKIEPRALEQQDATATSVPLACSVIIPCRNEVDHIVPFLDDLEAQEGMPEHWEILIADGMSDDGSLELLSDFAASHPRVKIIENPEGIVSTGLNRAILAAQGEHIVRMDVHTRYAPDYIQQCLAVIRETGATNVGGAARTEAEGLLPRAIAAAYGSPFAVGGARFHFAEYEGPVDTVTYGCWRRDDLLRLGMFDPELVRNQDDELNLRILRSGGVVWQSSSIRSWYRPRNSIGKLFKQYYQYGFWKVAVIGKHRIPASWRHLVPCTLVVSLLALAGFSFFFATARQFLALELLLYLGFLLAGSVRIGARRGFDLLPLLPAVIACFHFSYGLGFLRGLLAGRGRSTRMASDLSR